MTDRPAARGAIARRSAAFYAASGLTLLLFLPALPLAYAPVSVGWPVYRAFVRTQLWLLRVICRQRFVIDGDLKGQGGPVILACRHESMWETLAIPTLAGNPVVFLKSDLLKIPVVGTVARTFGYIGLDRSGDLTQLREAIDAARAQAHLGRSFMIFPNGTRDPQHRFRVQKGIAVLYRALDLPCVPVVLDSGLYWPHRSWLRHPGTIRVRVLPALPVGLRSSEFVSALEAALQQEA